MKTTHLPLPPPAPGMQRHLTVHEYGDGPRKAYFQAGLHADEWPGLLTLQHLMEKLDALEQAGQIRQRIVIVPFANPVGMNQRLFGKFPGRFDATTGQNFNRGMSLSTGALTHRVGHLLNAEADRNDVQVRAALRQLVEEKPAHYEIEALHKALLSQSIDAHLMLDLHCDDHALPHVFYGDHQRPIGTQLADCLGFAIRLEEDVRGTVAFDGSHTQPWITLAENTGKPFAEPCFAATVELRGQKDVSDALARQDAEGLLAFLEQQGFVSNSSAKAQPQQGDTLSINVDQVKVITSPANGLVVYHRALGDWVDAGDLLAEIVLLDSHRPERVQVPAPASGRLFSQTNTFLTSPGASIGMIASKDQQIQPGTQLSY
ncbi:succinylglutamate desuccinylase/aspartoacylase family protein [Saccharospirillum alexandrii]|uniref:succinylglutamate desuccinylase/aspartoacylase family protein n=1 Tax=Saccharospirillum alexandrii TaxID=2448477 RepID=UPI000FD98608|nr:succinylglutamate desuccinylase/aspartoacylase family protein [Saccharospirillum alexandrii]